MKDAPQGKSPEAKQAFPAHIQRMADASHLWGRLKWVHPSLADGLVDWDKALIDALPDIEVAETEEQQVASLKKLLGPLKDPALHVGPKTESLWVEADSTLPVVAWLPGDVVLFRLHHNLASWSAIYHSSIKAAQEALPRAKGLVFDLRPAEQPMMDSADFVKEIVAQVIPQTLDLPTQRMLFNQGYPPQSFSTSGDYFKAWMVQASQHLLPNAATRPCPVVFIVNQETPIPGVAMAMQKAGLAFILGEGQPNLGWVAPVERATVGPKLQVTFRVGDQIYPDGTSGFGVDQTVPPSVQVGPGSPAVQAALALLQSGKKPGAGITWAALPQVVRLEKEKAYPSMVFPDLAYRRLAVIRLWAVMETFFPYKSLMDRPWDDALPEFLARMEKVATAQEYVLTLAEMAARLQDNHVGLSGKHPELLKLRGEASLPVQLKVVEGKVVISRILAPDAAPNIHLWDEVLEIDGVTVKEAMKTLEPSICSANAWSRDLHFGTYLGRGLNESVATASLRDSKGRTRSISLKRSKGYPRHEAERDGEVITLMPGNTGYADLDRLEINQIDELMEKVKTTKALILDMRGYPNQTVWNLAPRLNVKGPSMAALFTPNIATGDPSGEFNSPSVSFLQPLPKGEGKSIYQGKVVMLIDENAQSQAEHTGLFIEAACDVTFIGSPSAGSNGDVTDTVLPGDIWVTFTGQGVRHADGRQLQRVGLQPHILVKPTLKGLRAGKDEVMERALRFVNTGK